MRSVRIWAPTRLDPISSSRAHGAWRWAFFGIFGPRPWGEMRHRSLCEASNLCIKLLCVPRILPALLLSRRDAFALRLSRKLIFATLIFAMSAF